MALTVAGGQIWTRKVTQEDDGVMLRQMAVVAAYRFRKVGAEDIDLLAQWQSRPHVREWWDADEPYEEADFEDPRVTQWVVSTKDGPFAFIQDYTVHGWPGHHFADLPEGSRGIDQYIGDPNMIGLGHGLGFIAAHMRTLFEAGVPVIGTDPHPDNLRAIAVYNKLGFDAYGPAQMTQWGLILPMRASRLPDR